jgi:hypothetical protein
MKGIIFTEFIQLVEEKFGLAVLDEMLDKAGDQGVYTAVGSYDHHHLVKLIVALSQISGTPAEELQQVFGESVFSSLYKTIPVNAQLKECQSVFQFIRHVEEHIHAEVKKLYPDANPPGFEFLSESETQMVFDYKSARCMSQVCLGLVKGCANHFNEDIRVTTQSMDERGQQVRFTLRLE